MPTTLGLLRVRGAGEDTPALRLGLTSLLATGDLEPAGLPPAAILVVRRVVDPIPGRLPARRRRVALDGAWERAVRDTLADQLRRARRPIHGEIDDATDAILFADEAEMLACFMIDAARGRAAQRWWWKHLRVRAGNHPSDDIERALVAYAVHAPGAFECLDRTGALGAVASAVAPESCWRVLDTIAAACGLPSIGPEVKRALASAIAGDPERHAPRATHAPARTPPRTEVPLAERGSDALPRPAEVGDVADRVTVAVLAPEQRVLCALLVAMHRSPARIGVPSFMKRVAAWAATPTASSLPRSERSHSSHHPGAPAPNVPTVPPANPTAVSDNRHDMPHRRADDGERATAVPVQGDRHPNDARTQHRVHGDDTDVDWLGPAEAWPMDAAVLTSLAGVLYVVNVMRDLGLPDCFEHDWRLATGAGAWGTLTGIASALLGDAFESWRTDPIWATLAALDGRPLREPIGAGCVEPERFEPPGSWQSFAEALPEEAVPRTLSAITLPMSAPFTRWLGHAVPPIRRRIAAAFGLPGTLTHEVSRLLLQHDGRVYTTSSHVDVVLPLDLVSLPVRRAGLDRSPGWVASFGRVIAFHFE